MKQVADKQDFVFLKNEAKVHHKVLSTNLTLFGKEQQETAEQGRMWSEVFEQGFALYVDEESYFRVFYYLDPYAELPDMHQEKKIVIEEQDFNGKRTRYLESFLPKLEKSGWVRIARNLQVSSSLQRRGNEIYSKFSTARARLLEQGFSLQMCEKDQIEQVIKLWKDNLRDTDLPGSHFRFYADGSQRVVVCLEPDGKVCGVNWWQIRNKTCEIRHSVTAPVYCKRGIGYSMQLAAMDDAVTHGCSTVFTYIDDSNYRSLGMFEKAGILPNGRISIQYGLK